MNQETGLPPLFNYHKDDSELRKGHKAEFHELTTAFGHASFSSSGSAEERRASLNKASPSSARNFSASTSSSSPHRNRVPANNSSSSRNKASSSGKRLHSDTASNDSQYSAAQALSAQFLDLPDDDDDDEDEEMNHHSASSGLNRFVAPPSFKNDKGGAGDDGMKPTSVNSITAGDSGDGDPLSASKKQKIAVGGVGVGGAAAAIQANLKTVPSEESYIEEYVESEHEVVEEEYEDEEYVEEEYYEDELPPRKITIRFDEFDEMTTVLHINDYTKGELNRTWYVRGDYDRMVHESRRIAEKVEERQQDPTKAEKKDKKPIEARGLEAWTTQGATRAKLVKAAAVDAVWNEQSRQWENGENDDLRIREAYIAISKDSISAAQARAFQDYIQVKKIIQEDERKAEQKRKENILAKSKHALGKSVKVTGSLAKKTGIVVGKTTLKTGKVVGKTTLKTAGFAVKASVATATLDSKALMKSIRDVTKDSKKKDKAEAAEGQTFKRPSLSSQFILEGKWERVRCSSRVRWNDLFSSFLLAP